MLKCSTKPREGKEAAMIETIPNPLQDKGVQRDIREKVEEILKSRGNEKNINDLVKHLVTRAERFVTAATSVT